VRFHGRGQAHVVSGPDQPFDAKILRLVTAARKGQLPQQASSRRQVVLPAMRQPPGAAGQVGAATSNQRSHGEASGAARQQGAGPGRADNGAQGGRSGFWLITEGNSGRSK